VIVAERLEGYLTQVVRNVIEVVDAKVLLKQIKHQQILFKEEQGPYCWVFDLLRAGASQITDLECYGLRLQPAWHNTPLTRIRDNLDQDFYALSCAYYDRYMAPTIKIDS
jgi:hypothetical protein